MVDYLMDPPPMQVDCEPSGQLTQHRWRTLNAHLNVVDTLQRADEAIEVFCKSWRISRHRVEAELETFRLPPPLRLQ